MFRLLLLIACCCCVVEGKKSVGGRWYQKQSCEINREMWDWVLFFLFPVHRMDARTEFWQIVGPSQHIKPIPLLYNPYQTCQLVFIGPNRSLDPVTHHIKQPLNFKRNVTISFSYITSVFNDMNDKDCSSKDCKYFP